MKEIIDYTVLIAAGMLVIGGAEYVESTYGINWWLTAAPLAMIALPLMDKFFKRASRASSPPSESSSG